ncbi:MFS transporter [Actinospica sp. MGRD01-02]|uniref:MFS transporter n=1 Tax=Actinospica acidithermotolerans TaxID=2828514 RepID=A0A941EEI8_9ACTN|nr:MFS transporter [Actinospica acidithermotolerans]MBR7829015.1 MFS transporter [Actinospica acidithermotolerans]
MSDLLTADAPPKDSRRWLALVVMLFAQLMVVLDSTVVNIAMPQAQAALHITDANRQWMLTAYTLTFGGLLLLGGRIADYVGRKRVFLVGLVGFALASALGGLAQNEGMLFGARALQGAFGAILAPASLSLITVTFTDVKERARAFGMLGAISGVGAAIGLVMGGWLTQDFSWRWCLFVNIIMAVVAFVAAVPLLHESKAHGNTRYDIPGAILATAGLASVVYGFTNAAKPGQGWGASETLLFLIGGGLALVAFVLVEARVSNPLLPLRVIWNGNRGGSYAASVFMGAGMFGMFMFFTYYFQQSLGYSPLKTGLLYLPFTGALIVTAGAVSPLLPRIGPRILMTYGALVAAGGLFWLTQLKLDSSYAGMILPSMVLMAHGMGCVFVPLANTALTGVSEHDAGVASAMVNTTQQIGGSLGVALLNTFFTTATATYVTAHKATLGVVQANVLGAIHGYNVAFMVSAFLLVAAAVIIFALIRKDPEHEGAVSGAPVDRPVVHVG